MRSRTGSRPNKSRNLYESEGDCTGERVAGQFSIFGAIEEKSGHGFSRINTDKTTTQGRVVLPLDGGRFCVDGVSQGKSGRVGSRNVHRTCTGIAERQWPVGSGQWPVLASRSSVVGLGSSVSL